MGAASDGAPVSGATSGRRSRSRAVAALLVIVGAALASGSAFAPWWRRAFDDPLTGALVVSADGTAVAAALFPLALVALAGLGAALATRGRSRRLIGAVVAAAGLGVSVAAFVATMTAPDSALAAELTRPASPTGAPDLVLVAPILGIAGGLVTALGGLAVARWQDRPRSGPGAYSPPAAQRDAARAAAERRAAGAGDAADRSEWWRSLDAGFDPTDDDAGEAADAPSGGDLPGGYDEGTRSVGREETDK